MSLAQTHDDEAQTKYQLSIRTTVPINSISSAKTAETKSHLRRTLARLCTFHNSKFGGETKLTADIIIAKESADTKVDTDTEADEMPTTIPAATTIVDTNQHQREPQTIEFTNGIVIHSTCNSNNNNKRNSVDYYV